MVCTDTHCIHESSKGFVLNKITYRESLILPTITIQSISTNIIKNILFPYKQQSMKRLINNLVQLIRVSDIQMML